MTAAVAFLPGPPADGARRAGSGDIPARHPSRADSSFTAAHARGVVG